MPAMNTPQFGWVKSRLPRKGQPVPPIFQPEVAARAIVWAAFHDRREINVGWPTVKAIMGNKFAPGWLDHYLARTCYEAQMTDEPEDPTRPNNLWEPVPGNHGAHGAFDDRSRRWSWQLWADLHRQWIALAGAGLAGLAVGLCSRRFPSRLPAEFAALAGAGKLIQNVQAMIAKSPPSLTQTLFTKGPGREPLFPSQGRAIPTQRWSSPLLVSCLSSDRNETS
ncbi:MAG: hypothetical protein ACXWOV_06475 [Isosphaeraceae bacterium]